MCLRSVMAGELNSQSLAIDRPRRGEPLLNSLKHGKVLSTCGLVMPGKPCWPRECSYPSSGPFMPSRGICISPSSLECYLWRGSPIGICMCSLVAAVLLSWTQFENVLFAVVWDLRQEKNGGFRSVWNCMKKIHEIYAFESLLLRWSS